MWSANSAAGVRISMNVRSYDVDLLTTPKPSGGLLLDFKCLGIVVVWGGLQCVLTLNDHNSRNINRKIKSNS